LRQRATLVHDGHDHRNMRSVLCRAVASINSRQIHRRMHRIAIRLVRTKGCRFDCGLVLDGNLVFRGGLVLNPAGAASFSRFGCANPSSECSAACRAPAVSCSCCAPAGSANCRMPADSATGSALTDPADCRLLFTANCSDDQSMLGNMSFFSETGAWMAFVRIAQQFVQSPSRSNRSVRNILCTICPYATAYVQVRIERCPSRTATIERLIRPVEARCAVPLSSTNFARTHRSPAFRSVSSPIQAWI